MIKLIPEGKKTRAKEVINQNEDCTLENRTFMPTCDRGSELLIIIYTDEGANHEQRQG